MKIPATLLDEWERYLKNASQLVKRGKAVTEFDPLQYQDASHSGNDSIALFTFDLPDDSGNLQESNNPSEAARRLCDRHNVFNLKGKYVEA